MLFRITLRTDVIQCSFFEQSSTRHCSVLKYYIPSYLLPRHILLFQRLKRIHLGFTLPSCENPSLDLQRCIVLKPNSIISCKTVPTPIFSATSTNPKPPPITPKPLNEILNILIRLDIFHLLCLSGPARFVYLGLLVQFLHGLGLILLTSLVMVEHNYKKLIRYISTTIRYISTTEHIINTHCTTGQIS